MKRSRRVCLKRKLEDFDVNVENESNINELDMNISKDSNVYHSSTNSVERSLELERLNLKNKILFSRKEMCIVSEEKSTGEYRQTYLDSNQSEKCFDEINLKKEPEDSYIEIKYENNVDQINTNMSDDSNNISEDENVAKRLSQCEGDSDGDGESRLPSLRIESWRGQQNFSINFRSTHFSNNKQWSYNGDINKLYILRTASVPVEVSMNSWIDCTLNITPVYLTSQLSKPVRRCHNHRIADESRGYPNPMHIIEVVNPEARHISIGGRFSVEIPLGSHDPGATSKIIHLRSGCWNTCCDPSKYRLCLIFTLFASGGHEIGRHVINLKSCQSPIRDMQNEMNKYTASLQAKVKTKDTYLEPKNAIPDTARSSSIVDDPIGFQSLLVPSDIASDVKKYINSLLAERVAQKNKDFVPYFTDV